MKSIESLVNILMALVMLILQINKRSTCYAQAINLKKPIHILGNGPSLQKDLKNILDVRPNSSMVAVNSFCNTTEFGKIKPEYYFIVDPGFFIESDDVRLNEVKNQALESLLQNVNWYMMLIVPANYKNSTFIEEVKSNRFIKVVFIKNVPIVKGINTVNIFLFKYKLANPLFQNVLITAIFWCLQAGYKSIYLWGADHSWHEDLKLGVDNIVYTPDTHFYDEKDRKYFAHQNSGIPLKVHEEFYSFARAFEIYHLLNDYAKSIGCSIFNLSSKTWIDAFKRGE